MALKKVIIAPDSFKGALSAGEAADIIAGEIHKAFPDCEVIKMPIADGGEGSVDAVLSAIGGRILSADVLSPDKRQIEATYGIAGNGLAIIEMAQSSGITRQLELNPMTSNTYGFGELILAAINNITKKEFTLCIGGSATTDGGCGMAAALGVKFTDKRGSSFIPCGETLCNIAGIDTSCIDERIKASKFTVMCDVDNPLFGEKGAAYIYSPQKGADPEQVIILNAGLRHYGAILSNHFDRDFSEIPGAGAAGGLGAGCMAFLNAELKSGIDTILELYNFTKNLKGTDLIITGEGKLDSQSFQGKVLSGIKRSAAGVPIMVICGINKCDPKLLEELGIKVFEASEGITAEESIKEPAKYLKRAAKKAALSIKTENRPLS